MGMTKISLFPSFCCRTVAGGLFGVLLLALAAAVFGQSTQAVESKETETLSGSPHAALLDIDGAIGPAILDYLRRSLEKADDSGAVVVIVRLDTPGGLVATTREIIRLVLDSPIPIVVYVAPQGARAASAGTYMVYASHVAAMAPATHLGAATPVRIGGGSLPFGSSPEKNDKAEDAEKSSEGEKTPSGEEAMDQKIISDAIAYIRSLAELRGRNADWAEKAVRVGASLTSTQALEKNVIDLIAPNIVTLLEAMDGKVVKVRDRDWTMSTKGLSVQSIEPDWRTRFLSVLTDPNVAYVLILLGLYGLIFEFANPGSLVPGVAGAILLLLGLFAMQLLPINYAGLALIILGIILMVGEAFSPSFGVLGIGGVIAFVIGSIFLIDTDVPEFEIRWPVIASFAIASALVFVFVFTMALKAWKRPVVSGPEAVVGTTARAIENFEREGRVCLQGESWKARSTTPIRKDQIVRVTQSENLLLDVEPIVEPETDNEKPKAS